MQRILFALFCALISHGGILLLPWPEHAQLAPQLPGAESITVSFDDCAVAQQRVAQVQTSPTPPQQAPQQQTVATDAPLPKLDKVTPDEPEPLQPTTEKEVKHIRPPTRKKQLQTKKKPAQNVQNTSEGEPSKSTTQHPSSPAQQAAAAPVTSQASPLYLSNPKPTYPPLARRRGWQGVVMISVLVLEDGSPKHIQLQQGSGYQLLDKAALKAVQKWHFVPATKDGIPTVGKVIVPVHFQIN
jgi:protein TonB